MMDSPTADAVEDDNSSGGGQGKPGHTALAQRKNDERCEQWADCAAGVASDLKDRLRKPMLTTRGKSRDPRRLRMKDGRTRTDDSGCKEQQAKSRSGGEQDCAYKRRAHAEGQREGNRTAVGKHTDEWLQK